MYFGQSQNFGVENELGNSRHIIAELSFPFDCVLVLLQSLSFLQRNSFIFLRSLWRYFAKHARSKHFPVSLALLECTLNELGSVVGRTTGGGRFCRFWFGKAK